MLLLFGISPVLFGARASPSLDGARVKPSLREIRIERFSGPILAFDIANDSDLAAVALSDLHVRIWKLSSGEVVHEFSFAEPATDQRLKLDVDVEPISLHFSPNGKILAVSFLNVIHLFDVETWQENTSLAVEGEDKLRPGVTITPQTPQLKPRTAGQARTQSEQPIGDINQTMRKWAAELHKGDGRTRLRDFSFVKDGLFILASYCRGACWTWPGVRWDAFPSGKDPLRLWNLHSTKIVWEKVYDPRGVISRVVPSPEGERFAAVDSELGRCAVGVYDLSDGRVLWSHPLGPCDQPPSVTFLRDGQSLITNRVEEGNRKNKLWRYAAIYRTNDGKKIADLSGQKGIRNADISPNGRWLVSTSWGGREFQIWDMQSKKIVITQVPKALRRWVLGRVLFSPDGRWLFVGSTETAALAVYQFGDTGQTDLHP